MQEMPSDQLRQQGAAQKVMWRIFLSIGLLGAAMTQTALAEDAPSLGSQNGDVSDAQNLAIKRFGVPASLAGIYEKLNRKVDCHFEEATLEEIKNSLAESLEGSIKIDLDDISKEQAYNQIHLVIDHQVSIKKVLPVVIQNAALNGFQVSLHRDGVQIIGPEAAKEKYVLKTIDLRGPSNYTTLLRREFMELVRSQITPKAWDKKDGPWLVPTSSVFELDIYHTPAMHQKITKLWQDQYAKTAWVLPLVNYMEKPRAVGAGKLTPEEIAKRAAELREQYPFKSLTERLKYEEGRAADENPILTPEAASRLAQREQTKMTGGWGDTRRRSLELLHGDEVAQFVTREGFGMFRMPSPAPSYLPSKALPRLALPSKGIEPPQNDAPATIPNNEADLAAAATIRLPLRRELSELHAASETTFFLPSRFGYVKSREEVAGFASHALSRLPRLADHLSWYDEPTEQWVTRRLELVSMLKHKTPRVYISESIPQLDKLADVETRNLNAFEQFALEKIQAGEDVVTGATINRIEMLGALRATKTCMECHEVKRGQVLGAFSYTLIRDPHLKLENTIPQ